MLNILEKSSPALKQLAEKGSIEWAKDVRKRAKNLVGQIDVSYMDLAEVLWDIHSTPAYGDPQNGPVFQVLYKYEDFGQFCEEELQIHRAKAQRLLKIWQKVGIELAHVDAQLRKQLIGQGFSKVRELVRVVNAENVAAWVEKAEKLSYPKLCQAITAYSDAQRHFQNQIIQQKTEALEVIKAADNGDEVEASVLAKAKEIMAIPLEPSIKIDPKAINPDTSSGFNFSLYPDQRTTVVDALEAASKMTGSVKKSYNLTMICMEFLANNVAAGGDSLTSYFARLESLLGLKLIAIDSDSDTVVYGAKNL